MTGRTGFLIVHHGAIRATVDADSATRANILIHGDSAVRLLDYCFRRTEFSACGIITMKADHRYKVHVELIAYVPRPYRFNPAPPGASRISEPVLFAARNLACMAADTIVQVYKKNLIQQSLLPSSVSCRADTGAGRCR